MNSSKTISMKKILESLSKFQALCPPIVRTSTNPFFKSKYASFDEIQKHIKPHLANSGLVITQANMVFEGLPFVESVVWHIESGENIRSVFPVIAGKLTAQDYGSAVSYAKRYSLTGLLNLIIADEDNDANIVTVGTPNSGLIINKTENSNFGGFEAKSVQVSPEPSVLGPEKYDAMVKFITEGKIKEVESAMKKYSLSESQKKLLTTMINQYKSEAITKSAKK